MSRTIQVGSFRWMKTLNKSTILNMIRLHGPISRAEIAKMTKLTPPTVTNIVGELLESNLVIEAELGESTGGRKPIMLKINADAFTVIGIYAGAKRIRGVAANLEGEVQHTVHVEVPTEPAAEVFVDLVQGAIRQLLELADLRTRPCLGIGVGMHGLVDTEKGVSIFAPNLNIRDLPLKDRLEQAFQLPVEVENDVRALALGESWFGLGKDIADFICVHVGTGIGAGIILNNELYRGPSFAAGEIGHTTIDLNGPKCGCGNMGCLEALAAGPAILSRVREAIRQGRSTVLAEWVNGETGRLTGEMVHRAAQQGDDLAIEVLADAGRYLGIGLANLINTLNPSRIILSGGVARAGHFVLEPLQKTVRERALSAAAKDVAIMCSRLGDNGAAIGAMTLVLQHLFMPSYA
ncbi:ROK family transcriptional regulator [Polycladomyces zharkentensis]